MHFSTNTRTLIRKQPRAEIPEEESQCDDDVVMVCIKKQIRTHICS